MHSILYISIIVVAISIGLVVQFATNAILPNPPVREERIRRREDLLLLEGLIKIDRPSVVTPAIGFVLEKGKLNRYL